MTIRTGLLLAAPLAALLAMAPGAAVADPTIFFDDTGLGNPPSDPPVLSVQGGVQPVELYLDPGSLVTSNGGDLCQSGTGLGGDGDETCGAHFEVSVSGDLSIVDFTDHAGTLEANIAPTGQRLSVALVTTLDPLPAGPTLIGTIQVDTSGSFGGTGRLEMLQTVDADLELQTGVPRILFFVPEPDLAIGLIAGALLLALLARRRA